MIVSCFLKDKHIFANLWYNICTRLYLYLKGAPSERLFCTEKPPSQNTRRSFKPLNHAIILLYLVILVHWCLPMYFFIMAKFKIKKTTTETVMANVPMRNFSSNLAQFLLKIGFNQFYLILKMPLYQLFSTI